ncbi:MAG: hypothetical protein IPH88_17145 [Bacteroidales bacterium]|nr:hypothetical protein [Bacteroidales bacterium]
MESKSFFKKLFGSSPVKEDPAAVKMGDPISLSKYDIKDVLLENSIIYLQTQIAFPSEKIYISMPGKDDNEEIVLVFKDFNGVIYGTYKYIKLDVTSIDLDKLIDYYSKSYISNILYKTVHKTFIDGREAFIVTGKTNESKFDYFTAVIIEGSNLTIFNLITDENFLFLDPDFAYKTFASYKFIKNSNQNQRIIKDFICFKNDNGLMKYFKDDGSSRGYYTFYTNPSLNLSITVGIEEVAHDSILSLKDTYKDNDGTCFKDTLKFGSKEIEADGFNQKDWLIYLIKYKGNNIQFSMNINKIDPEQDLSRDHLKESDLWPQILEIVSENFYFNF